MTNNINKIKVDELLDDAESGLAFIKKESHKENNFKTDVFTVYGADGTLLAAFEAIISAFKNSPLDAIVWRALYRTLVPRKW